MADLSVSSTTNAPITVAKNTTASTPLGRISQKKLDILKQEAEINKQIIEVQKKYYEAVKKQNEQILKEILKKEDLSREMLIMKLMKGGYIKENIKNIKSLSDIDIIEAYDKYMSREIEQYKPKWA